MLLFWLTGIKNYDKIYKNDKARSDKMEEKEELSKEELPWDKENNIELNSYIAYLFRRKEND